MDEIKEELQTCLQTVKEDVRNIKREMQRQQWQIDALEQYSRRDNIKIIGFPEPAQGRTEDTSRMVIDMCEKIGVDILSNDISTSLRIPGQAKAVACKFVRREVKSNIMRANKKLNDDLTSVASCCVRSRKTAE